MDLQRLWEIQQLEVKEDELLKALKKEQEKESKIKRIEKKIQFNEQLSERKKAEYDALKKDLVRKNHDLKALETEFKALNEKLYGGEITNLKEIENANTRINNMQKQISILEEEIIGQMEREEKMKADWSNFKNELEELKKKFQRYCNHHQNMMEKFNVEKEKIAAQKEEIIKTVDPVLWKRYQSLKAEKKKPLARLFNGICSGCNLSVSLSNYYRAKDGTMIMRCENCGRILYVQQDRKK